MASDKIVNKILESANQEAQETIDRANQQAKEQVAEINKDTQKRLDGLKQQFLTDCSEFEKRSKLNAGIEERKKLLAAKREVMDQAFEVAREKLRNLDEETWKKFITEIVLAGTVTDTEYIKVPEKDYKRFTSRSSNGKTFLEVLNEQLRKAGHDRPLKLDEHPAHFSDGIMLIGKYSDVNASFDVILDNMREDLEWNVSEILFGPGE